MYTLSPNIFVKDLEKTIEFYKQLGFNVIASVPEKGTLDWAMMNCGEVNFMFQSFKSLGDELPEISRNDGGSLLFYIKLKEIEKFFDEINEKVKIVKGLEKTFYGALEFSIQDINGYIITFAQEEEKSE